MDARAASTNTFAISFLSSGAPDARKARARLSAQYGDCAPEEADVIVALGGDGLMLQTLHRDDGQAEADLRHELRLRRLSDERIFRSATCPSGSPPRGPRSCIRWRWRRSTSRASKTFARAINEVSLLRQTSQAAKMTISVDGAVRLDELIADGVLVSTPAGSTAYNLSVNGPIVPLGAPLMTLMPISAFRPRRWRGALLPDQARVAIEILEADKRPVAATADHFEIRRVARVEIATDHDTTLVLLHDPGHSLDERILREQFGY